MDLTKPKTNDLAVEVNPGKGDFLIAVGDSIPITLGVIPFGITCGIMGITAGMSPVLIILMSVLVFAGASQFIGITMIGAGVSGWGIIVFTTLLVNLRHLLMGMSLAPYMLKLPLPFQAVLAFILTDESYALTASRTQTDKYSGCYQLGASLPLYIVWILSTALGVFLGSHIADPLSWGLDFAMPAAFLVLLAPMLVNRSSLIVCLTAAVAAVLGAMYLPGKWYIIISCLAAVLAGGLLEGGKDNGQ